MLALSAPRLGFWASCVCLGSRGSGGVVVSGLRCGVGALETPHAPHRDASPELVFVFIQYTLASRRVGTVLTLQGMLDRRAPRTHV